jgi:hypothetical protein
MSEKTELLKGAETELTAFRHHYQEHRAQIEEWRGRTSV